MTFFLIICSNFRCEDGTFTEECDVDMKDSFPSTDLTTNGNAYEIFTPGYYCPAPGYVPNRALKAILPAIPGQCWVLYPVKSFDALSGGDPCDCQCEDHIKVKERWSPSEAYFCGHSGTWCPNPLGPDNVPDVFRAGQCIYVSSLIHNT